MHKLRFMMTSIIFLVIFLFNGAYAAVTPLQQPTIMPQQVAALALNRIEVGENAITVEHYQHRAVFTEQGLDFRPRQGPSWKWQLRYVGSEDSRDSGGAPSTAIPLQATPDSIDFTRGDVIERYVIKPLAIEQQFIITTPLSLYGKDLLVEGRVQTSGFLDSSRAADKGWMWKNAEGQVTLGKVTVFDATGSELPARMVVAQNRTQIIVDGRALTKATYPVTIDPLVGANFQVSDANAGDATTFDTADPAVVYNSQDNQFLAVWWEDNATTGDGSFEIVGAFVAANGTPGTPFIISENDGSNGRRPDVAYNSTDNEYLVVWREGDGEEIFSRRLPSDGSTTNPVIKISDMAAAGTGRNADYPAVAYNETSNQYLAVWQGDGTSTNDELEIFGQLINADGTLNGGNIRISTQGPEGDTDAEALVPDVAYNATDNQFLVVWQGDKSDSGSDDFEIFGQLVNADGTLIGDNVNISNLGSGPFDAVNPAVVHNSALNQYFVGWCGDNAATTNQVFEILGQRVDNALAGVGGNIRISGETVPCPYKDRDPVTGTGGWLTTPALAYNSVNDEYMVNWHGSLKGRRFDSDGTPIDATSVDFSSQSGEHSPATAHNSKFNVYLTVWRADNGTNDFEIYGQRFAGSATMKFFSKDFGVTEGATATITVLRIGDTTKTVQVDYATSDGTAIAPGDYTTATGTLNFAATETSKTFDVSTNDNAAADGDKTVNLTLSNELPTGEVALDSNNDTATLTITDNDVAQNPIADAGADQSVDVGANVTLDGAGTSDPNGGALTYAWQQTVGDPVSLNGANTATPSFTAPGTPQTVTFELTVTDSDGLQDTDLVDITVSAINQVPVADAGSDRIVNFNATVTLDGTRSTDPDGDQLTYMWVQTAGDAVTLSGADTATPSFTAPATAQALEFQLTVTDSRQLSSSDNATVTTQSSDSGGGGGGCALRANADFDPMLPMLMILAAVYLYRRRSRS